MKILITGSNGFVGRHLCELLVKQGHELITPTRKDIGNINDQTDWRSNLVGCDSVIHLASRVHVMNENSNDPLRDFREVNVDGTLELAKQAVSAGVKRFVFVSSIKVNGEESKFKAFSASDLPAPLDPYGQSKMEAEIELRKIERTTGLEVAIVRPPIVYGPGVRANFLLLMKIIKARIPLPLGAIHNQRSMVAIDNLVDLLSVCSTHPRASGGTFLVSDDHDVSTTELLILLSKAMGKHSFLIPIPSVIIACCAGILGKSNVADRLLNSLQVDIEQTKLTLDWKPVIGIEEAIKKTAIHFLKNN